MSDTSQALNQRRLLASVAREASSDCWLWRGQISNSGYGRMMTTGSSGRLMESSHRASYIAFIGPIPDGGQVRQTCGNRLCVNPQHLELFLEQSFQQ